MAYYEINLEKLVYCRFVMVASYNYTNNKSMHFNQLSAAAISRDILDRMYAEKCHDIGFVDFHVNSLFMLHKNVMEMIKNNQQPKFIKETMKRIGAHNVSCFVQHGRK